MKTLKIKHTLKIEEDGVTISGQITDVVWGSNQRGDGVIVRHKEFDIISVCRPELTVNTIAIWGEYKEKDNYILKYTYPSPKKAKAMMDFIMCYEVKKEEGLEEGNRCYVSDESYEDAVIEKRKRIFLCKVPGKFHNPYVCVNTGDEEHYKNGIKGHVILRKYGVPIAQKEKKSYTIELTDEQYEKIKKEVLSSQ